LNLETKIVSADPIYSQLSEMVRIGRAVSLAILIRVQPEGGSLLTGAKMLVAGDGPTVGTIHPDVDASIITDAAGMMREERSGIVTYERAAVTLDVFIESFPPPQKLVIVGAVHVAVPLSRLAKMLGYHVTVVDPREIFATRARFPDADDLLVAWPDEAFPDLPLDASTSVATLTHDPKIDVPALMLALNSQARYVGALGSRTTFAQRKAELVALGATEEQVARVHAPIGLKIGSRTPAEIALSIMAEIVAARRGAN
jgi:xanthine dehydrogenase accessory factor